MHRFNGFRIATQVLSIPSCRSSISPLLYWRIVFNCARNRAFNIFALISSVNTHVSEHGYNPRCLFGKVFSATWNAAFISRFVPEPEWGVG